MDDQFTKFNILCPNCNNNFELDSVISDSIKTKLKGEVELRHKQELERIKKELELKKNQFESKEKEFEEKKKEEWQKILSEKNKIRQDAINEASSDYSAKLALMEDEIERKNKRLEESQKKELELLQTKRQFEEEKRNFELDKQRQLDEEREKMKKELAESITEENHYKIAEKDKQISDMSKMIEELKRKVQLGSQQNQGEVVELELEKSLKETFPFDEIVPVGKGINGADIVEKVFSRTANFAGTILWEVKQTKNWSEGWVQKLKDDMRNSKAELGIIITNALPNDIKNFAFRDGVWVTNYTSWTGLATALRNSLIEVSMAKGLSLNKKEKMEVVYDYLCGTEFKQRIESIVETFVQMKDSLDAEKRVYTKLWSVREKQIQKVIDNTIGIHGDLIGLGASIQSIPNLELSSLDDDKAIGELF